MKCLLRLFYQCVIKRELDQGMLSIRAFCILSDMILPKKYGDPFQGMLAV